MKIFKFIIFYLIFLTIFSAYSEEWVNGYYRKDGTWVNRYKRSDKNNTVRDNYSYYGNENPYTGKIGTNKYKNDPTSEYYVGDLDYYDDYDEYDYKNEEEFDEGDDEIYIPRNNYTSQFQYMEKINEKYNAENYYYSFRHKNLNFLQNGGGISKEVVVNYNCPYCDKIVSSKDENCKFCKVKLPERNLDNNNEKKSKKVSKHINGVGEIWELYNNGKYEEVINLANEIIEKDGKKAGELHKSIRRMPAKYNYSKYQLVNDVAVAYYLLGESYYKLKDMSKSSMYFVKAAIKFPYAHCYNPNGKWWRVSTEALKRSNEIEKVKY